MYKNVGAHAEDTAEGAVVAPGETTGENFNPEDPFNKRLIDEDVFIPIEGENHPDATPGALELADQEGVPLTAVTGTGSGGRITKEDVERHIAEASGEEG